MTCYDSEIHSDTPVMPREIGDDYFKRLFPDRDDSDAPINRPREEPPARSESEYVYKTVRVPGAKASRRRHEQALNEFAADGWELVEVQPRGVLQFGTKDTVTLRRKR